MNIKDAYVHVGPSGTNEKALLKDFTITAAQITLTRAIQNDAGTGDKTETITIPTWNQNTTGNAATATKLSVIKSTATTAHYLTFVDSVNSTASNENFYTTSNIAITPSTGKLIFGNMNGGLQWSVNYINTGWEKDFISFLQHTNNDSSEALSEVFRIGSYGGVNGYIYTYIGGGSYNSDQNLRFNKDGSITIGTNKVWHAGNDGPNSGLDADLLDGQHLSDLDIRYVPKQSNTHFYPYIGSAFGKQWYKVTLAHHGHYRENATSWYMISMQINIGSSYQSSFTGKILLDYYFSKASGEAGAYSTGPSLKGLVYGLKTSDPGITIKYDLADPTIFYIKAAASNYNSISITDLSANDTAPNFDFRNTTIEPVDSCPSNCDQVVPLIFLQTTNGNNLLINNDAIITAGNYTSYLYSQSQSDARYVLKAGDTMTGALIAPSLSVTGAATFSQAINGSILGNAATASRLQNARTISLTGSVTGSGTFDGSGNLSIATTTNHNHNSSYMTACALFTGASAATSVTTSLTNGNVYLNATKTINGTATNVGSIKISGSTGISVTTDTNGHITVTGTTSYLRVGAAGATANVTSATLNPYLALVEGTTQSSQVQLLASTGISISANNGVITFTNTSTNSHTYTSTWTAKTDDVNYPIAFSPNATPVTSGNGYNSGFTFNPGTKTFNNNGCRQQYDSTNKVLKFIFD